MLWFSLPLTQATEWQSIAVSWGEKEINTDLIRALESRPWGCSLITPILRLEGFKLKVSLKPKYRMILSPKTPKPNQMKNHPIKRSCCINPKGPGFWHLGWKARNSASSTLESDCLVIPPCVIFLSLTVSLIVK